MLPEALLVEHAEDLKTSSVAKKKHLGGVVG